MALINCPECGNDVSDKAESCPKCGHPVSEIKKENEQRDPDKMAGASQERTRKNEEKESPPQSKPIDSPESSTQHTEESEIHPTRRFFARVFDYSIGAAIFGFFFAAYLRANNPTMDVQEISNIVRFSSILLVPLLWIPIDQLFLYSWGTSPGKWFLNIRVKNLNGETISLNKAFLRSVSVWGIGIGLGLPIINLFCMYFSGRKLKKEGKTWWDNKFDIEVTHSDPSWFKFITFIILFPIVFIL